jgi:hypothetical protein
MKASAIAPRQWALRRADGGNVADKGDQTAQQPTILDFRKEIRMVATMDYGRRQNCSKEEGGGTQDYSTLVDNYTADDDDDNNGHGKITQQSNSSQEMEWMMMGMSKEGCAVGGGGARMPFFSLTQ